MSGNQQATCESGCARYVRFVALVAEFHQAVQPALEKLRSLPAPEVLDTASDLAALESELGRVAAVLRNIERGFATRFDSGNLMQFGGSADASAGTFGVISNLSLSNQVETMKRTAQARRENLETVR